MAAWSLGLAMVGYLCQICVNTCGDGDDDGGGNGEGEGYGDGDGDNVQDSHRYTR